MARLLGGGLGGNKFNYFFFLFCQLFWGYQASAVSYRGEDILAIDLHMHPGKFSDLGPVGKQYLRDTMPSFMPSALKDWSLSVVSRFQMDPYGPFIGIKSECERAEMTMCGLFAVDAPDTWGVVTNESLLSYLTDPRNKSHSGSPYFFGLATIKMNPWERIQGEQLRQLRKYLSHPLIKGIKLAFIHNNVPLDSSKYDSIYQLASKMSVPVYHHVGTSPLRHLADFKSKSEKKKYQKSYDPSLLERAIKKFPDVSFILGHVGFDFNDEGQSSVETVLRLAEHYDNVFIEISAIGDVIHDPHGRNMLSVLGRIQKLGLIKKTLYGSDGPTIPGGAKIYLENTLDAMKALSFSVSEAESILYYNTARLFDVP